MASLFKAVRINSGFFGRSKHKKLPEEWGDSIKQPVLDGITFYVKYLGSTLVEEPNGQQSTADAIKAIISMAKASSKKLQRVAMTVNPKGILISDLNSGETQSNFSIYRISFCSADANYDRVVAFIATNKNETYECHAFLCSKRKVAQAAALTISQAFNIAFDIWEHAQGEKLNQTSNQDKESAENKTKESSSESNNGPERNNQITLIDFNNESETVTNETMRKLGFEHDMNLNDSFSTLAQSRSHPMFNTNYKTEDLKNLEQFVQNQGESCDMDPFMEEQTDDLLSL
ncbi:low density lipoprotein receptor adapter protein 1-B-like [Centruroides vittatus]|uniref:low density lipoprotein receptor adapter protein 1-B-like n=1 Tax=Centruroides vittatus TaxID=120091 RepID=UPI00350F6F28